jgi:hypothetical protein
MGQLHRATPVDVRQNLGQPEGGTLLAGTAYRPAPPKQHAQLLRDERALGAARAAVLRGWR